MSLSRPSSLSPAALRHRFDRRSRRLELARGVRESLVSLAGLIGRPVRHPGGELVGRVSDVVARWDSTEAYPPVTGLVVRVGLRRAFVASDAVATVRPSEVVLATARLSLREFRPRENEVVLGRDVLDHQLVDMDGARVVRASDLYLATVAGQVRLVGVDVGFGSLLRRLGPSRWRTRATPDAVIDWASVHSFGAPASEVGRGRAAVRLARHRGELDRLRPAELADLLEDLGREERHQLLDVVEPDAAADALEEMESDKLSQLLTESPPERAVELVERMEPDEAAEALRGLRAAQRRAVLAALPTSTSQAVGEVLGHDPNSAGGIMTTTLVTASVADAVTDVRALLSREGEHPADLDAVVVVDGEGRLVDDISVGELLVADPTTPLGDLTGPPWPVTVPPELGVREVAERMLEGRRLSVLVVDETDRPVGRILADDLLDTLLPDLDRVRFPHLP